MPDSLKNATHAEAPDYEEAFHETAAERAAILPADLLQVRFDIPQAVNTVYAAVGRLVGLRQLIVDSVKDTDMTAFDRLRTYAQALSVAHIKRSRPSASSELLTRSLIRATEMRDQFLMDANTLAGRGIISHARIEELRGGIGFLNVAYDLARLVDMLKERWEEVHANSGVKQTELEEAARLFQLITEQNAERNKQTTAASSANDDRVRAYTLLVHAYDEVRRAVSYVRWKEGDVDKIVPSLFATRRKGAASEEEQTGDPVEPVTTQPLPQPASPVVSPPVEIGMPHASPFL